MENFRTWFTDATVLGPKLSDAETVSNLRDNDVITCDEGVFNGHSGNIDVGAERLIDVGGASVPLSTKGYRLMWLAGPFWPQSLSGKETVLASEMRAAVEADCKRRGHILEKSRQSVDAREPDPVRIIAKCVAEFIKGKLKEWSAGIWTGEKQYNPATDSVVLVGSVARFLLGGSFPAVNLQH